MNDLVLFDVLILQVDPREDGPSVPPLPLLERPDLPFQFNHDPVVADLMNNENPFLLSRKLRDGRSAREDVEREFREDVANPVEEGRVGAGRETRMAVMDQSVGRDVES